jgi:hypothetical protein
MSDQHTAPVGFAGLAALASNRDLELAIAASKASLAPADPAQRGKQAPPHNTEATSTAPPTSSAPASGHSSRTWVTRIFWAAIGIGVLWYLSNENTTPRHTSGETRTTYSIVPSETVPFAGTGNTLNDSEIRYCVSQDIRIDGARSAVNNYLGWQVDTFNRLVSDYNSRCSNFRYRRGSLERIRAEVEARRTTLLIEGANLVNSPR